jgi:hypothetical protein
MYFIVIAEKLLELFAPLSKRPIPLTLRRVVPKNAAANAHRLK